MRDAKEINVQRAIIHVVDTKQKQIKLSDAELSIKEEPRFREYINGRVESALRDSATCSAKFIDSHSHLTAKHCYQILQKKSLFAQASRELAQLLFAAMNTHHKISPGSLIVCLCSASNYTNAFLALVKVDYSDMLKLKEEKDSSGNQIIRLEISKDVLPSERERLQKAAIVHSRQPDAPYDLLLLDRQTEKVAANFFARGFLYAEPTLDARARTVRFYKGYMKGLKQLTHPSKDGEPALIKPEEAVVLRQQMQVALNSKRISVPELLDNLILPDEAIQILNEEISRQLPIEQEFEIDPEKAEELVKVARFSGQYGVRFEVEANHWDEVVKGAPETFTAPNGQTITRLTIEVTDFVMEK
ncbi:MAG: nucleoid-associated protein [Acidobacteria bacterium]|nr:nucleoid-associated protein [Acidobacteriota bacterium]